MRTPHDSVTGPANLRSAAWYLLWLLGQRRWQVLAGAVLSSVALAAEAFAPAALGKAIDAGIGGKDIDALVRWALILLALGLIDAGAGIMRHRFAVSNWLAGMYTTSRLTVWQAGRLGAGLPRQVTTGEVVSIGTSDVAKIGGVLDMTARATGSLVAMVIVTVLLLHTSVPLGLVVVLGVPLLTAVMALLIRPLQRRQQQYREHESVLTGRANDIITGLRVLRGIGGEATFSAHYRRESQLLRVAGVRVAQVDSLLAAANTLMPGLFVTAIVWLGARFALDGSITIGQLIAFYGYAAFLMKPIRWIGEAIDRFTRGHVAAARVVNYLRLEPELADQGVGLRPDPAGALVDPDTGLTVAPGRLTAVAAVVPEQGQAIADRLARFVDSDARLGGHALRDLPLSAVRETMVLGDNDAHLFAGELRRQLDPHGVADDERITAALAAAGATDIVEALPDGLDTVITARGRDFSGGQQQRLRLARALILDPPVLLLVEPTSAVDAHTEARIAAALRTARAGRTTVIFGTSPLLLDAADEVAFVDERLVAAGPHRELLHTSPRYAAAVTREED